MADSRAVLVDTLDSFRSSSALITSISSLNIGRMSRLPEAAVRRSFSIMALIANFFFRADNLESIRRVPPVPRIIFRLESARKISNGFSLDSIRAVPPSTWISAEPPFAARVSSSRAVIR